MHTPIYLDYNATTPVDPAVVEAMMPFHTERFGNPSSSHQQGHVAAEAVAVARGQVAALIGARPSEIVFTGAGSESDNLAIKGSVFARLPERSHVVASSIEHPAILASLRYLNRRLGTEYTLVNVDEHGRVRPDEVRDAMRSNTVLVSVMHANNEVGTLQPVAEIAAVAHAHGAVMHVDAAQAIGKVEVRVDALGADLLTIAGHKIYGPKGVGVLYIRDGTRLDPLINGGSQEGNRRAGTENVASIVGLGYAADLAARHLPGEAVRLAGLRDLLEARLLAAVPGLLTNGHPSHRLPGTLNVSFPGASGQTVLAFCPEVAASTGSACHSAAPEPSPVLLAMGLGAERALGAVRLSLGRWSTSDEVVRAADALAAAHRQVRAGLAPV